MERRTFTLNGQTFTVTIRDEVDDSVFNEIIRYREYRVAESVIFEAAHAILDVGAHAGFFTLYAKCFNKNVRIIAVEPESSNLSALEQNLNENKITGVTVVAGALSATAGSRELYLSPDSHNHSLLPGGSLTTRSVKGFTLKNLADKNKIKKFSLIKMDIEGGEYELLKTWGPSDYALFGTLVLEYHQTKELRLKTLETTLRENGFGVRNFPSQFDKSMGFLFATNKRSPV